MKKVVFDTRKTLLNSNRAYLYCILFVSIALLSVAPSGAAVTHASTTTGSGQLGAAAGSVTFTHDSGSGSERFLIVAVWYDASSAHSVSGVTYDGVAMTSAGTPAAASNRRLALFTLSNPAAGSNTVQITHGAGIGTVEWRAIAITYAGVQQTTSFRNYNTASGTDFSAPYDANLAITSQSTDLVYAAAGSREGGRTWTAGSGQTERGDINGASTLSLATSDEAGAASVAMDHAASDFITYAVAGLSIIPADGSTPPSAVCGNSIVESGEQCDSGASNGACPASCSSSCTTNTCTVPDTTPPSQVTGLTATATSSSQINLAWSAATDAVGVTGYRIYRGGTQIATTASTSYSNTGLTASTAYSYTIAAYDAAGNIGTQSASSQATTQATAPPPSSSGLLFESDWNTATGTSTAAMRDGTRWEGGGSISGVDTATNLGLTNWPTVNAWMLSTTAGQTQITTQVLWKNNIGSPVTAGSHRYWRLYTQVLWPNTYGTNTYNGYEHGWEGVQPAGPATGQQDFFSIQRIPRSDGTWFIGYTNYLNGRRYVCSPLLNKAQTYRIELHQAFFATYYTVELRVYDHTNALMLDESDCYDYSITGQPNLNAVQFAFDPATQGILPTALHMGTNGPGPTGAWSPAPYGNHYIYAHGAFCVRDDTWCGPYGGTPPPTPVDTTPPTQVTGLTATATNSSQINLAWSAASDAVGVTGYRIYREGTQIATTASTSYSNTGLTASTTYSYTIAAYDAAGNIGTQSTTAQTTTQTGTPPTGGLTPVFFSDWRTAAAGIDGRNDNGKWNELGGYGLEVTSASGLDFPFANVLNITAYSANSGFGMNRKSSMSIPSVGSTRHYRWYVQMNFPDELMGNGDHPWQDGNAVGDVNWFVGVHYGSMNGWPNPVPRPNQWRIGVFIIPPTGGSIDFSQGPWLDKGQTYRVEVVLNRLTAETYDLDIYIYDSSGTLLYDSADFPAAFGGGTLATRGPYTIRYPNNLDGLNMGVNDFYPVSGTINGAAYNNDWWTSTFHYGYQGGFAVVDNQGLIGPYGSVEGEILASTPPPARRIGDLNGDGIVNILDVSLIIQNFKRRGNYDTGADINNDGTVNILDMVLLGRNWGDGSTPSQPPSGQLTPVFFSDWRTITPGAGTTTSENRIKMSDNGKWNTSWIGGADSGLIIEAPAGFPTQNALSIVYRDGLTMVRKNNMPIPPIGSTRTYRWYYRHDQPNWPTDNQQHPIQDGNAISQTSWAFNTDTLSDTTWQVYFGVQGNSGENPWATNRWYSPTLNTGQVYRFELQLYRISETTFNLHPRVYDSAGTLLYDNDDFRNPLTPPTLWLSSNPTLNFHATYGAGSLDGLNAGVNGISGVTQNGFPYAVQAGFAVVDNLPVGTFIGPYGSVEGEITP